MAGTDRKGEPLSVELDDDEIVVSVAGLDLPTSGQTGQGAGLEWNVSNNDSIQSAGLRVAQVLASADAGRPRFVVLQDGSGYRLLASGRYRRPDSHEPSHSFDDLEKAGSAFAFDSGPREV